MKKLLLTVSLLAGLLFIGGCDQIQALLDSCEEPEEGHMVCSSQGGDDEGDD